MIKNQKINKLFPVILCLAGSAQILAQSPPIPVSRSNRAGLESIYRSLLKSRGSLPVDNLDANGLWVIPVDRPAAQPGANHALPSPRNPVVIPNPVTPLSTGRAADLSPAQRAEPPAARQETRRSETPPAARQEIRRTEPMPAVASRSTTGTAARNNIPAVNLPTEVTPTPRTRYAYRAPDFYKGIYINNVTVRTPRMYRPILERAVQAGINTLVVDVQPLFPSDEFIKYARESGFYLVSRIVVFEGGLKTYPPPLAHIGIIVDTAEKSGRNGFMEVQLDYIRFADNPNIVNLSLAQRYRMLEGILKMTTDRVRPLGLRVGADIFGRIAFNRDDWIGQKIEIFANHLDTIYPMLYPSHFYHEPHRINDPYRTILEGTQNCVNRSAGRAKIVAYIQGFPMSIGSHTYDAYLRKQIQASHDAGGGGFIVWNITNHYDAFFRALLQVDPGNQW